MIPAHPARRTPPPPYILLSRLRRNRPLGASDTVSLSYQGRLVSVVGEWANS